MNLSTLKKRDDFGGWLNQNGLVGVGVEVGTLYGEYMETIMERWYGRLLHCIDPWEKQPSWVYREPVNDSNWGEIYASAKARADKFHPRVNLIRGYSPQESEKFADGYLDFVYLDGRHDLEAVRADIAAWWPKIKTGGLLCGHDFRLEHNETQCCDVKTAVESFVKDNNLKLHTTYAPGDCGWWIIKI